MVQARRDSLKTRETTPSEADKTGLADENEQALLTECGTGPERGASNRSAHVREPERSTARCRTPAAAQRPRAYRARGGFVRGLIADLAGRRVPRGRGHVHGTPGMGGQQSAGVGDRGNRAPLFSPGLISPTDRLSTALSHDRKVRIHIRPGAHSISNRSERSRMRRISP